MAFTSAAFVVFLLVTLGVYWATSGMLRRLVLLLASLAFYAFWDYRFLALVAYVTVVAYAGGRALSVWPSGKRAVVGTSVALQLAQLAFFKYTNFALEAFSTLLAHAGVARPTHHFDILLPVGVSFYTFHGISYVVDCYRGKLQKPEGFLTVALYIVFFPQLVAGPIVRADVFLPQLARMPKLTTHDLLVGLKFLAMGLVYKSLLADKLAPLVELVFHTPRLFDRPSVAKAVVGFYAQIYFDFAGYSLMAIGTSRLFGFKLPKNFDHPYRAVTITDSWRRWHISLSSWLRDYLYIPLGGNRFGELRQYRNLMITMLLGGLWHGASYDFVLWGGGHGLALSAHKLYTTRVRPRIPFRIPKILALPLAWASTQALVLALWIPFRAATLDDALTIMRTLCFLPSAAHPKAAAIPLALLIAPLVTDLVFVQNPALPAVRFRPVWAVAVVLGVALALILPLMPLELSKFIYFQF